MLCLINEFEPANDAGHGADLQLSGLLVSNKL